MTIRSRGVSIATAVLAAALWGLVAGAPARAAEGPVISEFLAESDGSLLDEDGEASDWIEIHNPGSSAVRLLGWSLTDDERVPRMWTFPDVSLAPGERRIVFASGKDRAVAGSELHASFRLAAEGEDLVLFAPDGTTRASSIAPYPPQRIGFSFGLGRSLLPSPLIGPGSAAKVLVPSSGALGSSWTGGAEPFDDSSGGWFPVVLGIGYPGGGGPPPPIPRAYYSFDGNALDGAAGGRHGELRGGPAFSSDVPSKLGGGSSLRFDGVDDYVSADLDVSETAYTLSLWFKATAAGRGIFTVVGGDLGANGHDRHLYLSGGNAASRVWNDETISTTGKSYADSRWHHAAHVFGGQVGGQRIYVDGQLVATGAKMVSDFDWQEKVHIGFSNDAASTFFLGYIDDVSVWDAALSEDQVRALADGAHPMALSGYGPWIATVVDAAMRGVNASSYVRVGFGVATPPDFDALLLRVRHDDGFVAWLNGTEVARRNAPAALSFDSRAVSDRPAGAAIRPEEIDLGDRMGLLRDGRNVLAIQALNDRPDGADLLLEPELVGASDLGYRFLSPPTPGAANGSGAVDFVADTTFSVDRGFFDAPIDVEIATVTPGAAIYTTADGSLPSPDNPAARLYTGPVRISTTTTLRAAAFKDGLFPTDVDTQTYIFPSQVERQPASPAGYPSTWAGGFPADYGVDSRVVGSALPGYRFRDALLSIPTLSLTADPADLFDPSRGIYSNSQGRGPAWERAASIELIRPDGSRGFHAPCGIRMHGNSSRDHNFTPKHPIRLYFRRKYGLAKLEEDLFEGSRSESFDHLLLRGCSTDSWPVVDGGYVLGVQRWAARHAAYFRDQYMRDAQLDLGHPSCHGTYVHLFLDGLYWGIYNLSERPVDSFCANELGGEEEEYDVLKDFAELDAGSYDAWNAMLAQAGAGLATDAAYQRIQGRNPDGTRNPAYPVYLDVANLIDYMILHVASGAEDWPHHNWWAGRRRGQESTGFKFFVWDQEISNDSLVRTHTLFETRFEDPVASPSPSYLYGQCRANASFRRTFGDRVHALLFHDGVLSPEASSARWLERQTEIDRAIVGESARWGDSRRAAPYKREAEWLAEMEWMRTQYWPGVRPIAIERFRRVGLYPPVDAPELEVDGTPRHGGEIEPGDLLGMRVSAEPRVVEVPIVTAEAAVSALVPRDGALAGDWRELAYVEGSRGETWRHGQNGVGFETGTGYETLIHLDTEAEMYGASGNNSVFVRIPFSIPDPAFLASLEGLRLKVLFDDGFAAYLNGVRVAEANSPAEASIRWDSAATAAGAEANPSSPTEHDLGGSLGLLRSGPNLLAVHAFNSSNASSDMLIVAMLAGTRLESEVPAGAVYFTLDGTDPTDPAARAYDGPVPLERTTVVKARAKDGTEWSALVEAAFVDPGDLPLRISEVHYAPAADEMLDRHDADEYEFVEVVNAGPGPLTLDGIRLEGGIDFDFRESLVPVLEAGERLVIVENLLAFVERYPLAGVRIAGEYGGKLSNEGEELALRGPLGETLLRFRYDPEWYPETRGGGPSLAVVDETSRTSTWGSRSAWLPSVDLGGSPGRPEPGAPTGGFQRPGDSTQDGGLDVADVVSLLLRLFGGSPASLPCEGGSIAAGGNLALLDASGDGAVNVADAVHLLRFIFRDGPVPALGTGCIRIEGCPGVCRR